MRTLVLMAGRLEEAALASITDKALGGCPFLTHLTVKVNTPQNGVGYSRCAISLWRGSRS